MRLLLLAGLAGALVSPALSLAWAQDAVDQVIVDQVTVIATKGYANPDAAVVTNVRKSLARNGLGYCGEVTVEEGDGVATFHVLLDSASGPSVLRLSDFPDEDQSASAVTVRQLMKNFGCTE